MFASASGHYPVLYCTYGKQYSSLVWVQGRAHTAVKKTAHRLPHLPLCCSNSTHNLPGWLSLRCCCGGMACMQGGTVLLHICFFNTAAPPPQHLHLACPLHPAPCSLHSTPLLLRACTCTPLPQLPPGPAHCCFSARPSGPESPESKIPRINQPGRTGSAAAAAAAAASLHSWNSGLGPIPDQDRIDRRERT